MTYFTSAFTRAIRLLPLMGLATISAGYAAPKTEMTPAQIRELVEKQGAKAAVTSLASGGGDSAWETIMANIPSGKSEWLDLVAILEPGTDAWTSESLTVAISEALPLNPTRVLELVSPRRPVEQICADNRIEPTDQQVADFVSAAKKAVTSVKAKSLQSVKAACLAALDKLK